MCVCISPSQQIDNHIVSFFNSISPSSRGMTPEERLKPKADRKKPFKMYLTPSDIKEFERQLFQLTMTFVPITVGAAFMPWVLCALRSACVCVCLCVCAVFIFSFVPYIHTNTHTLIYTHTTFQSSTVMLTRHASSSC